MDKVKLVQPDMADPEIAEIFEDIRRTKGPNFLTPTWGFFGLDKELIKGWWILTKRLQMTPGSLPKPLLNAISLVCAAEVDCPRCINNHQTHLIEHFDMTTDEVMDCLDFENCETLDPMWRDVLRFARKVAFNEGTTDEDFIEDRPDTPQVGGCVVLFVEQDLRSHVERGAAQRVGESSWLEVPREAEIRNLDLRVRQIPRG